MAQSTGSKTAAEGAAQAADGAAHAARGAAQAAADAERLELQVHEPILRPIVYEVRSGGKGKKKKKYSRGLKEPQKLEEGTVRATERLAQAAVDGLGTFRKRCNRSSRKRRDGALKDALRNLSRGMEDALTTAAKAPSDLTRKVSVRRLTRIVLPPFPWPMR
jgi:hypothetical protein